MAKRVVVFVDYQNVYQSARTRSIVGLIHIGLAKSTRGLWEILSSNSTLARQNE